MSSLVLELQSDALNPSVSALNLIRKALVVARKLNIVEFQQWIELELNGYCSGQSIPKYRLIKGQIRGWNPYHGWQPIIADDKNILEVYERVCQCSVYQSISELVALIDKGENELRMQFPPQIESILASSVNTSVKVSISSASVKRIVESVRDIILKWTLKLEEDGIIGEGMIFSQREKQIAAEHDYSSIIQIYIGQSQMQNSSSKSQLNLEIFNNDLRKANVASFANQIKDNAYPQINQYNLSLEQQQNLADAAMEIQQLLEQLSQTYSKETISGRMKLVTEVITRIENNGNLMQRVLSALQAGGVSTLEQLLDHPVASFVIAALEDWQKTKDA